MTRADPMPLWLRTANGWRTSAPDKWEHFSERAAIREFCGGESREVAEREAYEETQRRYGK